MRRACKHLVLVALVSMFVGLGVTASHPESSHAQTAPPPNIVFILTDDMRKDDLNKDLVLGTENMPATNRLATQGMSFDNAFVSTALCCPARATIMRGQYAHNTGVWFNTNVYDRHGPDGGWRGYKGNGYERDNVATHLHDAGYRTGFFGKYLNGYDSKTVPAGWDDWFAFTGSPKYYDYYINDNGTRKYFGTNSSAYSTDVLNTQVQEFINDSAGTGKPFFAYVAPKAPHGPFPSNLPAPDPYEQQFDNAKAPLSDSFNEEDVDDKPPWIKSLPLLTTEGSNSDLADINRHFENRLESLQAVDDLVRYLLDELPPEVLANTDIVFTSDNGWFRGEHRIKNGKARSYEEAHRVPLVISGPGVQAGLTTDKLVLDTDYYPTFMNLAGASTPSYVDGRSLLPVLSDPSTTTWMRTAILLEQRKYTDDPEIPVNRNYFGIRATTGTSTAKYVEYEGGFREFYDLTPNADPDEMTNKYYSMNPNEPPISDEGQTPGLDSRLDTLKSCQAQNNPDTPETEIPCQQAEDGQAEDGP